MHAGLFPGSKSRHATNWAVSQPQFQNFRCQFLEDIFCLWLMLRQYLHSLPVCYDVTSQCACQKVTLSSQNLTKIMSVIKKNLQNKIWLWHLSYDYYSFNFRKQYLRHTLKDFVENNRSLFWVHTTPKWQDGLKMVLNRVVERDIYKSHMARQGWCVRTHPSALKHPVKSLAVHPLSLSSAIRTKGSWLVIYSL